MNAEIADCRSIPGPAENTVFEIIEKQRVCDDESLLREIFALLTQAHYRTRPADLLHLLDGDNLEMVRLHHDNETLAVALVAAEGDMQPGCSLPVWMNRRRPQNSLLPEILCAQLGFIEAMHLKIARIVRIVVKPQYQRGGLGSQLLGHISDHYANRVDLLGTAFSVSPGLLGFWLGNDYRVARTGVGKSRNTGSHSCVLVKGISSPGKELQEKVETKMLRNLPFQLTDTLRSLHPEIVMQIYATCLKPEMQPELDNADLQDLVAVGYAGRSLADAAAPLVKLVRTAIASDTPCLDKQQREFLVERFLQQKSWGECMALPPPRGKKPGTDLCRNIVIRILTSEYQSRVQPIMQEFQLNGEVEPCSR
jgi:tRNA(Met) cytidine acetyltransferase